MSYYHALMCMFLINIFLHQVNAYRVFERDSGVTILALEDETVNIQCQTNMPMAYCGFIHPSGVRYSFTGQGLKDGQCAIKRKVTTEDNGEWRCHIGREATGVELRQTILVRVVSQLAAIRPNITAVHGKSVTLECATTKRMTPLKYCRFEPPTGTPFSISPAVTAESPILGRFFYPLNKSLDRGDCVMTIRKVKYEDVGQWTCGAGLDDGKEHIDVISLGVEGLYTMSTASATGITFGAIGIAAFLGVLGIVAWKKRRFLGTGPPEEPEIIEIQELGPRPRTPRTSPHVSPRISPHVSPRTSPQPSRHIPSLIVQSPSLQGTPSATLYPVM